MYAEKQMSTVVKKTSSLCRNSKNGFRFFYFNKKVFSKKNKLKKVGWSEQNVNKPLLYISDILFFLSSFVAYRKQFNMSKVEHIVFRRQCLDAFSYSNEWTSAFK